MRVWKQLREVEIGGRDFSAFDMDIEVVNPGDDPLEFDITLYNLTDETYNRIEKGDDVRITLGWAEAEQDTVAVGELKRKRRTYSNNDLLFQFEGEDQTEDTVRKRESARWRDAPVNGIVEDIAGLIGLASEVDSVPGTIDGIWSITKDRKIKEWLDELLEYAAERTGTKWEWFVEEGTLYFVEKNSTVAEAPKLSYDGLLLSIDEKNDEDVTVETLEFEAMLDPRLRKGASVVVSTDRFSGVYKVIDYEFISSSIDGTHLVRGDVEATDEVQEYTPFVQ